MPRRCWRWPSRCPERVALIVYVAAFVPEDGEPAVTWHDSTWTEPPPAGVTITDVAFALKDGGGSTVRGFVIMGNDISLRRASEEAVRASEIRELRKQVEELLRRDAERERRAVAAELAPHKITDTLAFMFESRWVIAPTRFAAETPLLQPDYDACWADFAKARLPETR